MSEPLFQRVVVPVASEEDARTTAAALRPYLDSPGGTVVALHVIEKAGGALDKASVEQAEAAAEDVFDAVIDGLEDADVAVETEYRFGTDVAETIVEAAHDHDASAIAFTPRGGSRWVKLLTGDVATSLLDETDVPVLVLPDAADASEDGGETGA